MPAHLKEMGKTFAQYKEEIETFVVDSLAPWGVRSLVHLNAYPCFSRMLRARLFAAGGSSIVYSHHNYIVYRYTKHPKP